MSVDVNISQKSFNRKFKNLLRDCYVYQFKQKSDLRHKDTDQQPSTTTLHYDYSRIRAIIEQKAGITWSTMGENKRCVTIDGRILQKNPFHEVFGYSSEIAVNPGYNFAIAYLMFAFFCPEISSKVASPLTQEEMEQLNRVLKNWGTYAYNTNNHSRNRTFDEFPERKRLRTANEVISEFCKVSLFASKTELSSEERDLLDSFDNEVRRENGLKNAGIAGIYEKLFLNGQELYFDGENFRTQYRKDISLNEILMLLQRNKIYISERKTVLNKLSPLLELGILTKKGAGTKTSYEISSHFLKELLPPTESDDFLSRLTEMVAFFSQQSPLGSIGARLLKRLPDCTQHIYYRHNYLQRTLNDYNMIDLLYAIKHDLWVGIEYRNATAHNLKYNRILCYPMEIRESTVDGRQYLLYYHPVYRSVSAMRIEFIEHIAVGKLSKIDQHFQEDIDRAKKLINSTWGTSFDHFKEGNVKADAQPCEVRMLVKIENGEEYVMRRLKRELRLNPNVELVQDAENGPRIEVIIQTTSPYEMLPWLRTYVPHIVLLEKDGKPWNALFHDVKRTYDMYLDADYTVPFPNETDRPMAGPLILNDDFKLLRSKHEKHSLMFHEYAGHAFDSLGRLIFETLKKSSFDSGNLNDLAEKCVKEFFTFDYDSSDRPQRVFDDIYARAKEQVDVFLETFLEESDSKTNSRFQLKEGYVTKTAMDLIPLTLTELQWLQNILSHPYAECFLRKSEIETMLERLPKPNLFDVNDVYLYDQFQVEDGLCCCETVPIILKAIRNREKITFDYISQEKNTKEYTVCPVCLEYSKRNDRFYLYTVAKRNSVKIFSAERMKQVRRIGEPFQYDDAASRVRNYKSDPKQLKTVTVIFGEAKNTADRILTEFSCYRKECTRSGKDSYEMLLYYEKEEAGEIAARLLRYGPYIYVCNDTGPLTKIIERKLRMQYMLTKDITEDATPSHQDEWSR